MSWIDRSPGHMLPRITIPEGDGKPIAFFECSPGTADEHVIKKGYPTQIKTIASAVNCQRHGAAAKLHTVIRK